MRSQHPKSIQKLFPALGTLNAVTVYDTDTDTATAALTAVRERVLSMDQTMSLFRKDSEISEINRMAGIRPVAVHPDTLAVIASGIRLGKQTKGAFSLTAGPLNLLWKNAMKSGVLPDNDAVRNAGKRVRHGRVIIDTADRTVFLSRPGMMLDLGGIAKGYAVDVSASILRSFGIRHALISFGGSIRVLGESRTVGVQNPFQETGVSFGELDLPDSQAVVTNGSYEQQRLLEGHRCHHIIDPRTGWPTESGLVSVTLTGRNATVLDALATGAFVLGAKKSVPILRKTGIEGIFVFEDGTVRTTEGMNGRFRMSETDSKNLPA